jgi:tagaturonate reductase
MQSLNRQLVAEGALGVEHVPGAPVRPVSILQIGDGNFLRAFVDWMVDVAGGAGVAIAQPLDAGIAAPLRAQGHVYTVLLRGIENGREVVSRRVVTCVADAFNPYAEWERMLGYAVQPGLRFVVSNTTEAGIADVEEPFVEGRCPASFPAKVAALLAARYQALGGGEESGLVFLPCELIENNGTMLRAIVLRHAERWGLDAGFAEWVGQHCHFLNTLVDRIVPGFPRDEAETLFAGWGYRDPLAVAAEPFHVWVIDGPKRFAEELPLHKAGLNVVWTDDLRPYRTRKVRILNGAHTSSVLAAFCMGLDTVGAMMDDAMASAFLKRVMFEEIVPFVPLPQAERQQYAETILERFANPFIRHELLSIALNSVSKWRVRVLPSLKDYVASHGTAPRGLAFSLAALLWFYRGRMVDGAYVGSRAGVDYPIRDDAEVLAVIADAWARQGDDHRGLTDALLAQKALWGEDLTALPGLAGLVAARLAAIARDGMRGALADIAAA